MTAAAPLPNSEARKPPELAPTAPVALAVPDAAAVAAEVAADVPTPSALPIPGMKLDTSLASCALMM
jgi:hypothetical protein